MVADKNIVHERLDKIRQHRKLLSEYEQWNVTQLARDYGEQMKVLHLLQVAIEATIDISAHIVCADQLGAPTDHADLFRILGTKGILAEDFTLRLQQMARFRNKLVHFLS